MDSLDFLIFETSSPHPPRYELRKNNRAVGEICLELQVKQYSERAAESGKRKPASSSKPGHRPGGGSDGSSNDLSVDTEESLEFFTLSGGWQGFSWHAPMHSDRCYESTVQRYSPLCASPSGTGPPSAPPAEPD